MEKALAILGSTGSIGQQALDVARNLHLPVVALAANRNIKQLEEQIREFHPKLVAVYDKKAAKELAIAVADCKVQVVAGMEGLCLAATLPEAKMVLNAVVGMIGLKPTLQAIEAKKEIALANKETLVTGGDLVMERAKKQGVSILPVDSEHSAIFQCLQGASHGEVGKLLLTASGGPFFGKTKAELMAVTKEQALKHPNWSMGSKITIDSATMMNKGLEVIEAKHLFDVAPEQIEVVVHRESIVHSMVEFCDGSILAQMGVPDMRLPIQYALTYPNRFPSPATPLNFATCNQLTFYPPDMETFSCLSLCIEALKQGGLAPSIVNGANEMAVQLFLQDKISFLQIGELCAKAVEQCTPKGTAYDLETILAADQAARQFVQDQI